MVRVSAAYIFAALALSATSSVARADAPTYAEWKKSAYYKEAFNKGFLPPSTYKNQDNKGDGGEFSMGTSTGTSSVVTDEMARFEAALKQVDELKKLHPHATFSVNTPFALMTTEEFQAYVARNNINTDVMMKDSRNSTSTETRSNDDVDGGPKTRAAAPGETVDWQSYGCVTEVKDQAQCGACWAFSATAAMESGVCVETKQKSLPVLADQQLISCDNQGQSQGCGGGYASYTMDWVAKSRSGKMCSLATYPFTSSSGSVDSCRMGGCTEIDIGVTGFDSLRNDPGALEDKIRERPVSVFVYSGSPAFQYYTGGILTGENCDSTGDHSALAVGFGEDSGLKYWRLKNQWGTKWGEQGYVRIQRRFGNADGACGVEKYASWPTFKSNLVVDAPNPNFTPAAPTPAPEPAPTPAPEPAPTPAPEPAPTPAPEPAPTPAPVPAPTTAPEPAPTPAKTEPAQTVAPTPAPQPEPTPAPTPAKTEPAPEPTKPNQVPVTGAPNPAPTPAKTVPSPTPALTDMSTPSPADQRTTAPEIGGEGEAAGSGKCGALDQGVDYLGNDIKDAATATVGDCCALCQKTTGCNAYTFTTWNGGHCFMKSRAGLVVPNSIAVSSSLQDISKCTHQNTPMEVGYNYPGFDIKEVKAAAADECYEQCKNVDECNAFTWSSKNEGTCALKTRKVPSAEYKQADAGPMSYASAIVYKCQNLQTNVDFEGDDLANKPARSPEACCAICQQTDGCKAFSWTDYKTGTCWLKSGTGKTIAKGSVVSATL